jgi:hypothetical protein
MESVAFFCGAHVADTPRDPVNHRTDLPAGGPGASFVLSDGGDRDEWHGEVGDVLAADRKAGTTERHRLHRGQALRAGPNEASEAAVDQLFERIGMHASAGVMETQAAFDMRSAVARELLADRASGEPGLEPRLLRRQP